MFNFKQGLTYDEKNITKRRQNKACILCCYFLKMSFLQIYEFSTSKPRMFPSSLHISTVTLTLELT